MITTKHKRQKCPHCGTELDSATYLFDSTKTVTPGNFSMCMNCGRVIRFGPNMQLNILTQDDLAILSGDRELTRNLARMRRVWLNMRHKNARRN